METNKEQKSGSGKIGLKELLFIGLVLLLAAAHIMVMLQSIDIISPGR